MNCKNELCIYNVQNTCKLKEPTIGELGKCEEMSLVKLPSSILKSYKEKSNKQPENRPAEKDVNDKKSKDFANMDFDDYLPIIKTTCTLN